MKMINEKLREEMSKAYAEGNYKKALRLSRRLDRQIRDEYNAKRDKEKDKSKTPTMEI